MGTKRTNEQFQKELDEKYGIGQYLLVGEYQAIIKPVMIKHICGRVYETCPRHILKGHGCASCKQKARWNYEEILEEFKEYVRVNTDNQYKVISNEYVSAKDKIEMLHKQCNQTYLVTPNKFKRGRRCPYCYKNRLPR